MDYFTKAEKDEIFEALQDIGDIGIKIYPYEKHCETQREAFFGKAKLWNVIRTLLDKMFFDALLNTKFKQGLKTYQITEVKP